MQAYCIQYKQGDRPCAVLVYPDADGSVMSELKEGSGIMVGRLVSGGLVHIPMDAIIHVFAWWKHILNTGNGQKTVYRSDRNMNEVAESLSGNDESWDEDGTLKNVEKVDKPPKDAKRVYR